MSVIDTGPRVLSLQISYFSELQYFSIVLNFNPYKVTSIDLVGGNALLAFIKKKDVHLVDVPVKASSFLESQNLKNLIFHATVIDARHHTDTHSTLKC